MRIRSLVSAIVLSVSVMPAFAQQPAAPSADDLARRAIDVLAGPAWEKARYLAFTFNVVHEGKIATSFPQRWDRYTGQYMVSGRDPQGNDFVVIMNVNTKQGRAWKGGTEVTEPSTLELGYRRFINDTYWLLMPLKSMDPGVKREAAGERTDSCGHTWDLVKLSFDQGVGLTPGDVYWMWVNRDTGIVDEWDMHLQSMKPEEPPLSVLFHDFKRIGGVLLSTRRELRGKNSFIRLDDVQVLPEVPKGAFDAPK
jgi:hypothetical protein